MNSSGDNRFNRKVLPPAVAVRAMLNDADQYLPEAAGRGIHLEARCRYTVQLRFENEQFDEVNRWLNDLLSTFVLERGKLPWKQNGNDSDNN